MDFKFTLAIHNAASKDEAINAINEMLDNYDFYVRPVPEDGEEAVTIDWYDAEPELPDIDD